MLTIFLPFFGEFIVGFNYVRTRYGWGMVEYSDYSSICRIVDLIGQGILIPLLGYLELCDTTVIPVIISTIIARHVIKGLAYEPYLLYVASAVDLMGGYAFSAARSAVSKCVEMDELGKVSCSGFETVELQHFAGQVFALTYSVESLVPIMMTQAYASLWKATGAGKDQNQVNAPKVKSDLRITKDKRKKLFKICLVPGLGETMWVGSCFFVSAILTTIAFTLSIIGWCR